MTRMRSKLPDVGTTIFTVMSRMASDHAAINLSQGFPDFDAPAGLLDRVNHHMRAGHNQYAPMEGLPLLRERIVTKTADCYGRTLNAESEITITSGATEALFSAIEALVHTGDEVIIFDPAYDSYDPAIRLAGGLPVHLPLNTPSFSIDWNRVETALSSKTRMIILNSPHNPTGAVISQADTNILAELIRNLDVVLLSDEVYEHMCFDTVRHESMHLHEELAQRSLVVSSFGKTYHTTGWKIGYCAGPANLMAEFRRVHQFVQFCVASPLQFAIADFLDTDKSHYQNLSNFYAAKRDRFFDLLQPSRFKLRPSAGTYFQIADYSDISRENDIEFTRWMTVEKGVAAIPISVFYAEQPRQHLLRFCFAKNDATLEQAADILCTI